MTSPYAPGPLSGGGGGGVRESLEERERIRGDAATDTTQRRANAEFSSSYVNHARHSAWGVRVVSGWTPHPDTWASASPPPAVQRQGGVFDVVHDCCD